VGFHVLPILHPGAAELSEAKITIFGISPIASIVKEMKYFVIPV
jgi:hypothetical protein